MELKPGMKVELLPYDGNLPKGRPDIVGNMPKYMGKQVTINRIVDHFDNSEIVFKIDEDMGDGFFTFSSNWIRSMHMIPEELFEIEE